MEKEPKGIKEGIKDYVETKLDIVKLKAIDMETGAISGTILGVALFILGLFILAFLSFSAAYAISDAIGKQYSGFLIVGGFYILLATGVFFFREKLITLPILNKLLKKMYHKEAM